MKKTWISTFLLVVCSLPLSAQATYDVILTGVEHVPSVRTPAMGELEVWVEDNVLYVQGEFSDLQGYYWSAHVHYGEKGKTGNRLFRLKTNLNEEKNGGTFTAEENQFELRQAQREALRNGNLYIVVSSNRHQQGEIRGQIPRF